MSAPLSSVDRVLNLMRDTFGSKFNEYYSGDPEVIPKFNLPCIIVTQVRDDTTEGEMGEDDVTDQIRIKVIYDRSDDWTGSVVDPLNLTEAKLRDVVGTTPTKDGKYMPGTIKHALRSDLLEGVEAVAPTMEIEFGINPRETLGSEDNVAFAAEAWVTFGVQHAVDTY